MQDTSYWDSYYDKAASSITPTVPSQFGAFIASEFISERPTVVEFGCGNGRDALFFAQHGFRTIGVDASFSAIWMCNRAAANNATFLCSEIRSPDLPGRLKSLVGDENVLVYARFFIHAVDEEAERAFFTLARELCGGSGAAAIEFRTNRDEAFAKLTPAHHRRFINPMDFLVRAQAAGFQATYFVEGFGYAKFRHDDAHVARLILRPASPDRQRSTTDPVADAE